MRIASIFSILLFGTITAFGMPNDAQDNNKPLTLTVSPGSSHPVDVTVTFDPPNVQLGRDTLLTVKIIAPSEIDIQLPELNDRLEGFLIDGTYDLNNVTTDGKTTYERRAKLTPIIADEYRLAPMPIQYVDKSRAPAVSTWFPTQPVILSSDKIIDGPAPDSINVRVEPRWIYPSFKNVLLYITGLALIIGVVSLILLLLSRLRHDAQLRRMSPRERAMHEFSILLGKHLIEKNQVKQFYLELTMIVRSYIENLHSIRAPEQTTQEFLNAVADDPRFSPEVVQRLREFLEAADLVKFAAYKPEKKAIDNAVTTAKNYIELDSETLLNKQNGANKDVSVR
ncbi:MAG: hypothetical protein JXN60_07800 [Lentisphaerae bacterium]|nr:hypothetical protein [Lentisphaerota bacterium]